jgi:hypothetical protein
LILLRSFRALSLASSAGCAIFPSCSKRRAAGAKIAGHPLFFRRQRWRFASFFPCSVSPSLRGRLAQTYGVPAAGREAEPSAIRDDINEARAKHHSRSGPFTTENGLFGAFETGGLIEEWRSCQSTRTVL